MAEIMRLFADARLGISAGQADLSSIRTQQARNQTQQGRFPAAVAAGYQQRFPGSQGKAQA